MSDAEEQWVKIPGMIYEASDFGNVRRNGKTLKPLRLPHGYLQFAPCENGKWSRMYIHRAVALAFIGPCPEGHEVNHKNGCKSDNRPDNLEYVTRSQNMRHAHDTGIIPKRPSRAKPRILKGLARGDRHWTKTQPERVRRGESCHASKLTDAIVLAIRADAASGMRNCDIADKYNLGRPRITRIVNREQWVHI